MFIIAFDFGVKYIGVAIGQTVTKTATPLDTIFVKNNFSLWKIINNLIFDWKPAFIIIGKPLDDKFDNSIFFKKLNKFVKTLKFEINIPVYFVNETLSTWKAKKSFLIRKNKDYLKKVNAISAAIIIEQWFFENNIL